jgi:hypothetical protein
VIEPGRRTARVAGVRVHLEEIARAVERRGRLHAGRDARVAQRGILEGGDPRRGGEQGREVPARRVTGDADAIGRDPVRRGVGAQPAQGRLDVVDLGGEGGSPESLYSTLATT